MTAAAISGCDSGDTSGRSTQTVAADTGSKKGVVIWDHFRTDAQREMMTSLPDGFNSPQNEYVASRVYVPFPDYEKQFTLGVASRELPDLVILDSCSMTSLISLGLPSGISDAGVKWDEYIQGPMESTMADGRRYGIPFATNCMALFYNKDMFNATGVEYPDENTTWEQFHEMTKAPARGGITGFGNVATNMSEDTFQCLQWFYTAGDSYTDIKDGIKAYDLIQKTITDGSWIEECVDQTQSDVNSNFIAGNLTMQQNGPWQIPGIVKGTLDLNYGVTALPRVGDVSGRATSILGGENMGMVTKDGTVGAVVFLKYYDQTQVMVDVMRQYGSFPPRTEAAEGTYWTDGLIQVEFTTQLKTSIPRGPSASWPSYSSAIQKGFQEVLTLSKTPEQVAEDIQEVVDAVE